MTAPLFPAERHWTSAWRDLALPAPRAGLLDDVLARYREPHRQYHTVQHLAECLDHVARDRLIARHAGEVAVALWFHDVVYDTQRHDNEAESAAWARREIVELGGRDEVADRVHALIMATRHRERPGTDDERLLVDIDLAILGAAPARFDEYERQIRAEYGFVPDDVFRSKRAEVLRSFQERAVLYETPAYRDRFEGAARLNLARSLAELA